MEESDESNRNVKECQTFPKSRKRKKNQERRKEKKFKSEKDRKDHNNVSVASTSVSVKRGNSDPSNTEDFTASKPERKGRNYSRYKKIEGDQTNACKQTVKKPSDKNLYQNERKGKNLKPSERKSNFTTKFKGKKMAKASPSGESERESSCSKCVSNIQKSRTRSKNNSCDSKHCRFETKHRDMNDSKTGKQSGRENCSKNGKDKNMKYRRQKSWHKNYSKSQNYQSKHDKSKSSCCTETGINGKGLKDVNEDNNDECLVIPGFYYDKEKKKYFKILPNHSNISSTVTKEVIKKKEKEEKRLNDLAVLARKSHTVSVIPRKTSINLPHILFSHIQGDFTNKKIDNVFLNGRISDLNPKPVEILDIIPDAAGYERLEHMLQIDVNSDHDQILGLWSVKNSLLQRIQLLKICEKHRFSDRNPLSVHVGSTGRTVIQSLNKVSNVCWANIPGEENNNNILYTLMCPTGNFWSMARIRSLSTDNGTSANNNFDFMLGPKAVWTCAWNGYLKQFSVGSEKQSLLIDVRTRKLWELKTGDSDVLSQVFCQQGSPCLYSGTRKGQILTHDLRSNSVRPVSFLRMSSSVCCLKFLQDECKLVSSDVKGKISLWDVRMKKELVNYRGCKNEYSRLPVHIDEAERLLYGAGQDGYVNFWCLKSGKLLRSLPPPIVTDIDTIPAVTYSERWGNRQGNAGLIMGLGDKLYLYPSFRNPGEM